MSSSARVEATGTADRILDVAERLVQVRGFNGFSYADVARELAITKASLHYHFPGKAELGASLIARYDSRFSQALCQIDERVDTARAKLEAYVGIYSDVLAEARMCLCGILAAEYETLPAAMREAVQRFFEFNETWLTTVLSEGQADGTLSVSGSLVAESQMILSGLEGAMLLARAQKDSATFSSTVDRLLQRLTP